MTPHVMQHMEALERAREGSAPRGLVLVSNLAWDEPAPFAAARPAFTDAARGPLHRALARIPGAGRWLDDLLAAFALSRAARAGESVLLLEMDRRVLLFGLLRSLRPTRSPALAFALYLEPADPIRRALLRRALEGFDRVAVWSFAQRERTAQRLGMDPRRFVVLPYKANHSQSPAAEDPTVGEYVFSGGNSERDYRTLFAAVDGLSIPVTVSATAADPLRGLIPPPNVTVVRAVEPEFGRLMAGARVVALPLTAGRTRGAGEASFLNAMWHGRPVVVADDVSAPEYIRDGADGVVVPPGDPAALRAAIAALWADRDRAERIGAEGRRTVERWFTHRHFRERLLRLGARMAAGPLPDPDAVRTND